MKNNYLSAANPKVRNKLNGMTDDDLRSVLLSEGAYNSYEKRYAIGLLQARAYSVGYGKATTDIRAKMSKTQDPL
jgi:hypothetical protein